MKAMSTIQFPPGGEIVVYEDGSGVQKNIPRGKCQATYQIKKGWFGTKTKTCKLPTVFRCIVCGKWICSNHATPLSVTAWDYRFDFAVCDGGDCRSRLDSDPTYHPIGLAKRKVFRSSGLKRDPDVLRGHKVFVSGMTVTDLQSSIMVNYEPHEVVC